ncbi:hypothetical protein [Nocardia sp. SC052]|uniref:hypothetical protein n=1 Tax=Nocardia sichangensis TaxID=3385975 RepID=UPI00399F057D
MSVVEFAGNAVLLVLVFGGWPLLAYVIYRTALFVQDVLKRWKESRRRAIQLEKAMRKELGRIDREAAYSVLRMQAAFQHAQKLIREEVQRGGSERQRP